MIPHNTNGSGTLPKPSMKRRLKVPAKSYKEHMTLLLFRVLHVGLVKR
jgi:hypothetical protein